MPARFTGNDVRSFAVAALPWSVVAVLTALRAIAAARLPLTGDEAYYWEWSRHLAAGYVDHPPAVAYLIWVFSFLGRSALAVRVAFVLCGLLAAVATGATAQRLAGGDRRAGAVAALALTLAPMMNVAFGTASPDGPFLAAWACTLYCAVRAFESRLRGWYALLGAALAAALLSRLFALALIVGIVVPAFAPRRRHFWRDGLWLSLAIAGVLYVPFLLWNGQNGWITFAFALVQRHAPHPQLLRPLLLQGLIALAFSPALYVAAIGGAARVRNALLLWTALPMAIALTLLALREPVEVYWFYGPYLSLCVAIGVAYAGLLVRRRIAWAVACAIPAAALSALVFAAVFAPGAVYADARHAGLRLHDDGPFEVYTYSALARSVGQLAREKGAIVMTDGYGFSSELDFYDGLAPYVIGYDAQGAQARRWYSVHQPVHRALFVDKTSLRSRPDFTAQLARACDRVVPGPVLSYGYVGRFGAGIPERDYFTTWCDGMRSDSLGILQWKKGQTPARRGDGRLTER